MVTGFVDRLKGKITMPVGGQYIAGVQVNTTGADANTAAGAGTVYTSTGLGQTNIPFSTVVISSGFGLKQLFPTSSQPIFRLPKPVSPGGWVTINFSTINGSTGIIFTVSTDGSVVFSGVGSTGSTASFAGSGGSTLSNCIKSTQSHQFELQAVSTTTWLFAGVLPSTVGALTFSTST